MGSGGVSVLVADDNPLVRDLLQAVLDGAGDFRLVAADADAASAIASARELQPVLALVDVRMPGGGPAAARGISQASPATRIVALSSNDDADSVRLMLAAGATSYLVKGTPPDELLAELRAAVAPPSRPALRVVSGPPRRVLVAVTDPAALDRLADAIQSAPGLELVGLAQTAFHAISLAARLRPDVAVLDATMGSGSARIGATLAAASPATRIVAWSPSGERLASVLAGGRVEMLLQPIVGLADEHPHGYEALARFPGHPMPGPDVWFAEAHRAGIGVELERLAVRCGLEQLDEIPFDAFLSVNVSPDTVVSAGLLDDLSAIDASRVVIELTEHAPVTDYARLEVALSELRSRGARVAVDDCGAGFTSLRHVALIAPDFLKLDMILCRDVREPARAALTRALVAFAEETGSVVIAEGIEQIEDLIALRELGVGLGQGYLLSRPAPVERLLSA